MMVDPSTSQRWLYHLMFAGLALALLLMQLVPVGGGIRQIPGPDLLMCLVLVWVQRRPDYVPLVVLAPILLIADFLLMRPPGLWAGLTLIGAEFVRRQQLGGKDLPFMAEWSSVIAVIFAITIAHWAVNAIVAAPKVLIVPGLLQALTTSLAYPLVIVFSQTFLNVRKRPLDDQRFGGAR